VDPEALNFGQASWGTCPNGKSFQQDGLASHKGYQYVTYWDGERRLCLARRRLPDGKWEIIRFGDYRIRGNDTHNVSALGLCPGDGTIHLAFDHHGSRLHYCVSKPGAITEPETTMWAPALFGPVTSDLEKGKRIGGVTYPRFFTTPEGKLQFWFRVGGSGNGDWVLYEYDGVSGVWASLGLVVSRQGRYGSSTRRCAYMNGLHYDTEGRLHASWCWRETGGPLTNHDLCYAMSDDRGRTWLNGAGALVRRPADSTDTGPSHITVATEGIAVQRIQMRRGVYNSMTQIPDSRGRLHVMYHHMPPDAPDARSWRASKKASRYFHYWCTEDGTWHRTQLAFCGSRPKLLVDRHDNLYLFYSGDDVYGFYDLRIATASAAANWSDWHVVHQEPGPFNTQPLVDVYRAREEEVFSIYMQEKPHKNGTPTPLRIIDFKPMR
jgi:hypothetical protein